MASKSSGEDRNKGVADNAEGGEKESLQTYAALIEEKLRQRRSFVLERTPPAEQVRRRHTSLIVDHVTADLKRQLDEMSHEAEMTAADAQQPSTPRESGDFWTEIQLRNHFSEWLRVALDQPMKPLQVTVSSGSRMFWPPYDVQWTKGDTALMGKDGGSWTTLNAFTAGAREVSAGVGFYLSSDEPLWAAVTPHGVCKYHFSSGVASPSLWSSGGLGVAVQVNDEPGLALDRRAVLWTISGVPSGTFRGARCKSRTQRPLLPGSAQFPWYR